MKRHQNVRPDAEAENEDDQFKPDREAILELAHDLWIERGRPIGSPEEDWFQAEKMLQMKSSQAA